MTSCLEYSGCNEFRMRIVLAALACKSVRISKIRSQDETPGIRDFELSFLRLLEELSNGSVMKVNETGTVVTFHPGTLIGGQVDFESDLARGLGYYLEPCMILAPFCKTGVQLQLRGVSNCLADPSVDSIRYSCLPLLHRFLGRTDADLKLINRGCHPLGGAVVQFNCPVITKLRPLLLSDCSKIHRVRGIAWTCKVSPSVNTRMLMAAKNIISKFLPDVLITADHCSGVRGGNSPGFGITLVAETKSGCFYTAEQLSQPSGVSPPSIPEDIGEMAANQLCEEIYRGGCTDSVGQPLSLVLMSLCNRDVSKLLTAPLTSHSVRSLRLVKDYLNVSFKLDVQALPEGSKVGGDKLLCTCVGAGFSNLSKAIR